jgi:hypothetical protein
VKGEHASELIEEARKSGVGPTPRVNDGPAAPSTKTPLAPQAIPLSVDESSFAKFFGLSDDEYRHGKQILENPDLHWGQVITFDSETKKREQRRANAK